MFDLKGSTVNREVKITKKIKNTSTLKDLNLQYIKKHQAALNNDFIKFSKADLDSINNQLKRDLTMLQKFRLMDYSLLFAIERVDPAVIRPEVAEVPA